MLHINDLIYRAGTRLLLDHASVSVPAGHKVSLVGRNGTGKSTLLKMIAGQIEPDGGSVHVRPGARIGMLAQEAPSWKKSVLETVLEYDAERTQLLAENDALAEDGAADDAQRIADIHARLGDIDAWGAPSRAAGILAGLGFDEDAQQQPCADLSGGWRMRVALAGILFSQPDLLLLDEPTNHLDLESAIWLEGYLRSYQHTVVLVSHDRDILNAVPTSTIHLSGCKLKSYRGGYDRFEKTRREEMENLAATQARQQAERQRIQAFIDRFRAQANKARQAQSRIKALERMEPVATMIEEKTVSFDFPYPSPLAPPLIAMEDVATGYGLDPVLQNMNLRIDPDDRIALLGANGNGKSTLMRLLAGRLKAMSGTMTTPPKLKVGYFAQHQAEELDTTRTVLQQAWDAMPERPETKIRAHLGRFGFTADHADQTIGTLSGGEKARLLFALISVEAPQILLLDEPTNHLDVDSREALIHALSTYDGAVILVSHDPHLVRLCADRLWLVDGGTCAPYDGDLDDYRALLLEQRRAEQRQKKEEKKKEEKKEEKTDKKADSSTGQSRDAQKERRRAAAEARKKLAPLRKDIRKAETRLEKLEQQKQQIERKMADPDLYDGPADKLVSLQKDLADIEQDITETEDSWMQLTAELEEHSAANG